METCQETLPEAITAFLGSDSFKGAPPRPRIAASLGGDCDTLACIAGSIAEGFCIPEDLKTQSLWHLPDTLKTALARFAQPI